MNNRELAIELFRKIKNEFPQFKMDLLLVHKDVESMLDIPVQKGILIPINPVSYTHLTLPTSDLA